MDAAVSRPAVHPFAPRVVALGGGHGLSRALAALRLHGVEPVAVVTVADDGGSSGRLRDDLGIIAPGDLRMALETLARDAPLAGLFAHRYERGTLEGHAFGNLALVALAEREGGFVAALAEAARLLDCAGRVLPATPEPVRLKARIAGEEVDGQVRVATAGGPVERVWLDPAHPGACEEAVDAVEAADLVLLGPGSLFTSVIASLLVPDLAKAVADCRGAVAYLANVRTQPGETDGLSLGDHVGAIFDHVPGLRLDAVIAHEGEGGVVPEGCMGTDLDDDRVGRLLLADLLERDPDGTPGWGHDPRRLAVALRPLLERR